MNTKIDEDYERLKNKKPEDFGRKYNQEERKARRLLKSRITIRIDDDVLDEFKSLSPEGKGYQSLINQALREWLIARDVRSFLKEEISELMKETRSSLHREAEKV